MINKFKDFLARLRKPTAPPDTSVNWREKLATSVANARQKIAARIGKTAGNSDSIQWVARVEKILSKESFTSHHRAFILMFLVVATYSGGKITALLLRGRPTFETPAIPRDMTPGQDFSAAELAQVRASDPFKTSGGTRGPRIADTKCDTAENRTSLPLKLINTVVLQDSVKSIASVQVRSGRDLKEVHEGDKLDNLAQIFHITRQELVIKNLETGACELVTGDLPREKGPQLNVMSPSQANAFRQNKPIKGIENNGNKFTISRELLEDKLKDINAILTQARATQIQNPDGTISFKMSEIEPGGIFAYLGIQDGDIIDSINGKPITDLNEVMSKFGAIKNMDQLQLGMRRESGDVQLDYAIKK